MVTLTLRGINPSVIISNRQKISTHETLSCVGALGKICALTADLLVAIAAVSRGTRPNQVMRAEVQISAQVSNVSRDLRVVAALASALHSRAAATI